MQPFIYAVIEQIYVNKDYEFYLERCQGELTLPENFDAILKDYSLSINEFYKGRTWPAQKWSLKIKNTSVGEFFASFNSSLTISKIVPAFYIQHEFDVENKDEERIKPFLGGFSGKPYIKTQFDFDGQITEALIKTGYTKLNYAEFNAVVPELSFPKNVTIFGSQVTVEYALFHDLLGLCPDM